MLVSAAEMELFTNRFTSIALEMGEMLRRTAASTNIKERLDFSCGLLDTQGQLIVNAPHVPVHLGALGLCVQTLISSIRMEPGDTVITNHPAYGGSHLPDVTLVTPVYQTPDGGQLLGYMASRAHHAEIGGTWPGSMPPDATTLVEEGVIMPPMHLVRSGIGCWDDVERVMRSAPFPSRAVEDNLGDLRAALAANMRGADLLRALARIHGADAVIARMQQLVNLADQLTREALAQLDGAQLFGMELLDDGTPLQATIRVRQDHASVDFHGTGNVHPGNLNATPAIVRAVVMYVMRLLVNKPLPLNEGLLQPLELIIPRGSLLNPDFSGEHAPAVVGGNTEVSQRLAGTLIKAFGLMAGSQGTMNNVLFGSNEFGNYETVCGGAGATPHADGASAVHTHMTNTRITDPEVIEHRYPVRIERFEIRRGSGGNGARKGGDGVVREYKFLEPLSVAVLTQNRVKGPYGLEGGEPGMPGRQTLHHEDGTSEELGPNQGVQVKPGDSLVLETPGGGAFGAPSGIPR
jgi:5-oxoprolinase (ATP-hydrolysing)